MCTTPYLNKVVGEAVIVVYHNDRASFRTRFVVPIEKRTSSKRSACTRLFDGTKSFSLMLVFLKYT